MLTRHSANRHPADARFSPKNAIVLEVLLKEQEAQIVAERRAKTDRRRREKARSRRFCDGRGEDTIQSARP